MIASFKLGSANLGILDRRTVAFSFDAFLIIELEYLILQSYQSFKIHDHMRDYKPIYFSLNVNARTVLKVLTPHKLSNVLCVFAQILEQLL